MNRSSSVFLCVLSIVLTLGCSSDFTTQGGEWEEVNFQIDKDTCQLADDLSELEGELRYSLTEQTLSPYPRGGGDRNWERTEEMLDEARSDLWTGVSLLNGPLFEFDAFAPLALHADLWGAGMFMHEDCDGQPTGINIGGDATGMIVSPTEIVLDSYVVPRCMRDGEEFRWCKLEYTSRLVPVNGQDD